MFTWTLNEWINVQNRLCDSHSVLPFPFNYKTFINQKLIFISSFATPSCLCLALLPGASPGANAQGCTLVHKERHKQVKYWLVQWSPGELSCRDIGPGNKQNFRIWTWVLFNNFVAYIPLITLHGNQARLTVRRADFLKSESFTLKLLTTI